MTTGPTSGPAFVVPGVRAVWAEKSKPRLVGTRPKLTSLSAGPKVTLAR